MSLYAYREGRGSETCTRFIISILIWPLTVYLLAELNIYRYFATPSRSPCPVCVLEATCSRHYYVHLTLPYANSSVLVLKRCVTNEFHYYDIVLADVSLVKRQRSFATSFTPDLKVSEFSDELDLIERRVDRAFRFAIYLAYVSTRL